MKPNLKRVLFFTILLFQINVFSKSIAEEFNQKIDSLEVLKAKINLADDTTKVFLNSVFKSQFLELLQNENSLTFDFKNLKSVSVLSGPNNQFRIYTWVLELGEDTYDYFGFTQYLINAKKSKIQITELFNDPILNKLEQSIISPKNWLGALYYEIVPNPVKTEKKFLILGWDGNNAVSTKKIIEVLSFSSKGEPVFGSPILKVNVGTEQKIKYEIKSRVIFEYSEKTSMSLKYDLLLKMLVYDHLSPVNEGLVHVKSSYAPDFSYDGFYYKSGKWIQQSNLDARNPKMPKPKKYKPSDFE